MASTITPARAMDSWATRGFFAPARPLAQIGRRDVAYGQHQVQHPELCAAFAEQFAHVPPVRVEDAVLMGEVDDHGDHRDARHGDGSIEQIGVGHGPQAAHQAVDERQDAVDQQAGPERDVEDGLDDVSAAHGQGAAVEHAEGDHHDESCERADLAVAETQAVVIADGPPLEPPDRLHPDEGPEDHAARQPAHGRGGLEAALEVAGAHGGEIKRRCQQRRYKTPGHHGQGKIPPGDDEVLCRVHMLIPFERQIENGSHEEAEQDRYH